MRARNAWPLLLVVAGVAAGAIVAFAAEPTSQRAETTLVVTRSGAPVGQAPRTIASLVTADVVLDNAAQSLHLSGGAASLRPHVHVRDVAGSIRISYDAATSVEAIRVLQQVATVVTSVVQARFGAGGLTATIFDPPHAAGSVQPHRVRDVLVAGLLAAAAAVAVRRRRAPAADGRRRLSELRRAVERATPKHPERADDWRAYLAVLASQADGDFVPHELDPVVDEVFGEIVSGGSRGATASSR